MNKSKTLTKIKLHVIQFQYMTTYIVGSNILCCFIVIRQYCYLLSDIIIAIKLKWTVPPSHPVYDNTRTRSDKQKKVLQLKKNCNITICDMHDY